MYAGEFLQAPHASKSERGSLSWWEGEVGVFRSIIHVATVLLAAFVSNLFHHGIVGGTPVGDDHLPVVLAFQCLFALTIPT